MSTQRIRYVDAMRGLAMIMVVIWHVFTFSLHYENQFSSIFNWTLQMPLFVMISGFFVAKLLNSSFIKLLRKEFIHLVIPALIMLAIYSWTFSKSLHNVIFDTYKGGYWFTFLLFAYFLIFYTCSKLINHWVSKTSYRNSLHIIIALIIAYASRVATSLIDTYPIISLLSLELYCYYPYLIAGLLIYQYRSTLLKNIKMGGVILFSLLSNIVYYKYGISFLRYLAVPISLLVNTASLILIWICFERFPQLSISTKTGRFLSFVGRRSIDVYFLHYFFMPFNLGLIEDLCIELNSSLMSYLIATVLSLIITVLSLGLGQILRLSPFTAKYLLGVASIKNNSSLSSEISTSDPR